MHPIRKKRLTIVLFLVAGIAIAVGLTTYALRQNINLFYDPTEIAAGNAPVDVRIRAGGMVEEGSGVEDDLEQQNRDGGRTKRCHQGELDGHRDEDLNRMEA